MLPLTSKASNPADDIRKAETYLRELDTAKADFTQKAHNGARLTGTFYLDRPGRLRFEYNEVEDFIVADGFFVYFFDGELREQTNAPIGQTLADFLLRKDLKLSGDIEVTEIGYKGGLKTFTLVQSDDPASGQVVLFFSEVPYQLKKWQVTDAAGMTTEIELNNMETDLKLANSLFGFIHPDKKPGGFNE
ncbi:MAG: outer membrane lipoprotein carrier protein LolA [Pseudomonadota bacterium]